MKQKIAHIALVVKNYDEAIDFYTKKLHFNLIEDTCLSETKRCVIIVPKGSPSAEFAFETVKKECLGFSDLTYNAVGSIGQLAMR